MKTHNLDHIELVPGEPGAIRTTIAPQADDVRPLAPSLPDEAREFVDLTAELLAARRDRDTLQTIAANACLKIVGLELIVADLRQQLAEPHPSECVAS